MSMVLFMWACSSFVDNISSSSSGMRGTRSREGVAIVSRLQMSRNLVVTCGARQLGAEAPSPLSAQDWVGSSRASGGLFAAKFDLEGLQLFAQFDRLCTQLRDFKGLRLAIEGRLVHQPELFKHLSVCAALIVGRGKEFVACKNTVGAGHEAHALLCKTQFRTACRKTHHSMRHGDTRCRHTPHHLQACGLLNALHLKRRARHRHKCVDGYRLGVLRQRS
mmetsp:Transcript_65626/g.106381  ORF Transcript_65626/g.106381 Transcript_65626/m.106381 type:complete len:220 (+) Transcript_65626:352-1011(+)